MKNKERANSSEEEAQVDTSKKPGKFSRFLDSFGIGDRWQKEYEYIMSLPDQEAETIAHEDQHNASRFIDQLEDGVAAEAEETRRVVEEALEDVGNDPEIRSELHQPKLQSVIMKVLPRRDWRVQGEK